MVKSYLRRMEAQHQSNLRVIMNGRKNLFKMTTRFGYCFVLLILTKRELIQAEIFTLARWRFPVPFKSHGDCVSRADIQGQYKQSKAKGISQHCNFSHPHCQPHNYSKFKEEITWHNCVNLHLMFSRLWLAGSEAWQKKNTQAYSAGKKVSCPGLA